MPTEGEGGSAETPQIQTAPTAPVLDFRLRTFQSQAQWKCQGTELQTGSSSDNSGRITSLAPG